MGFIQHKETSMFMPTVAVGELMLRSAIVYVFVFVLLRMLGKKHVGEMAPFDLVILLILSESRTHWWRMRSQ
jgi:uncharacterized membrane protein YcaP (DUF421 family)